MIWEWTNQDPQREVVVWDATGHWARGLRRYLDGAIPVVPLPEFPAIAADDETVFLNRPPSVMVMRVRPTWDVATWKCLFQLVQQSPRSLLITITSREDAVGRVWSVILGARSVFHDLGQLEQVAAVIGRFWGSISRSELLQNELI